MLAKSFFTVVVLLAIVFTRAEAKSLFLLFGPGNLFSNSAKQDKFNEDFYFYKNSAIHLLLLLKTCINFVVLQTDICKQNVLGHY